MSKVEDLRERSACTVKCKVFDIARRQSGGRAGHLAGHQRRLVQYPRESDFVLSFSPLFLPFFFPRCGNPSLIILHEIAWKRRNSPAGDAPSRCFATFRNINYAIPVKLYTRMVWQRRGGGGVAYRFSRRGIIPKGVLKYLRPCN
jgi:hypothetical protein